MSEEPTKPYIEKKMPMVEELERLYGQDLQGLQAKDMYYLIAHIAEGLYLTQPGVVPEEVVALNKLIQQQVTNIRNPQLRDGNELLKILVEAVSKKLGDGK